MGVSAHRRTERYDVSRSVGVGAQTFLLGMRKIEDGERAPLYVRQQNNLILFPWRREEKYKTRIVYSSVIISGNDKSGFLLLILCGWVDAHAAPNDWIIKLQKLKLGLFRHSSFPWYFILYSCFLATSATTKTSKLPGNAIIDKYVSF